jgi:hypothetical protein
MDGMTRGLVRAVVVTVAAAGTTVMAGQSLTRNEADSLDRKLADIMRRGAVVRPAAAAAAVKTAITEREVNAYFQYQGKEQLPVGLLNPVFTIADAGRVQARALVDLDAVRTSKQRSLLDPANLLTGTVEVRATGKLVASEGKGLVVIESATAAGVPISKSILQTLVSYYSRTPENPEGVSLDKPFALPAGIRAVETQRGAATIIQ